MLLSMGLASAAELSDHIPDSLILRRDLDLPEALSEHALEAHVRELARKNIDLYAVSSFIGGGMYEHHIPAVVDAIAERGEYLTAYTPYQPEMSQGLLQVLSEYQSYMSAIAGLPVVNSSSYDGATAFADALWMAHQATVSERPSIYVASTVWPQVRAVADTYLGGRRVGVSSAPFNSRTGLIDLQKLEAMFERARPSVLGFQTPNCFGVLENVEEVVALCKKFDVLSVLHYHPFLAGIFVPPGQLGVDIVCGEAQMLGIALASGGPSLGFLASRSEYHRFMPGRIVGTVSDIYGNPAYALVHEEREQHVAREKATSNMCSNQAHCALRATVYLSATGETGLTQLAHENASKARDFASLLTQTGKMSLRFQGPFFNEFMVTMPCAASEVLAKLRAVGIRGGLDGKMFGIPDSILIAVTETKSCAEIDAAASAFRTALAALGY